MSGNLGGTYESFLERCIGGTRKEQEAFRELAELNKQLEVLDARKRELLMPEEWGNEGTGELMAACMKGKEEFEQEGDVYTALLPLKNLVRHREKALATWVEELRRQEAERRRMREQEEAEARRKREQAEAEARRRREQEENNRRAKKKARRKKILFVVLVVFVVLGWIGYREEKRIEAADAQAKAEIAAMQARTTPGETKTIRLPGGATMEMVWCPPGTFTMGSNDGDDDETPHQVTLTHGFWMGKYEVTQAQWKSVMGNNPSRFEGDNRPVKNVSWNDCKQFCKKTGLQLPTEAQWEYACRAGSTGDYAGTGNLDDMGWSGRNSRGETHPVGTKQPNAWGLYDMHGNVWEWCSDWYGNYSNGAVTDPQGSSSGSRRVGRGGSWSLDAGYCTSSYRSSLDPSYADYNIGFRLVRTLSE